MRLLHGVLILTCLMTVSVAFAETMACPTRNGVYAFSNHRWLELKPVLAKKVKSRAAFPAHNKVIAQYPGSSSQTVLRSDVSLCGTGIPVGTTFRLALAKQDDRNREVIIGTMNPFSSSFSFDIDKKQEVELQQTVDNSGTYLLHAPHAPDGQYILFMQQGSSLSSTPAAFDFSVEWKVD